jgi:hypothetical protein
MKDFNDIKKAIVKEFEDIASYKFQLHKAGNGVYHQEQITDLNMLLNDMNSCYDLIKAIESYHRLKSARLNKEKNNA